MNQRHSELIDLCFNVIDTDLLITKDPFQNKWGFIALYTDPHAGVMKILHNSGIVYPNQSSMAQAAQSYIQIVQDSAINNPFAVDFAPDGFFSSVFADQVRYAISRPNTQYVRLSFLLEAPNHIYC